MQERLGQNQRLLRNSTTFRITGWQITNLTRNSETPVPLFLSLTSGICYFASMIGTGGTHLKPDRFADFALTYFASKKTLYTPSDNYWSPSAGGGRSGEQSERGETANQHISIFMFFHNSCDANGGPSLFILNQERFQRQAHHCFSPDFSQSTLKMPHKTLCIK